MDVLLYSVPRLFYNKDLAARHGGANLFFGYLRISTRLALGGPCQSFARQCDCPQLPRWTVVHKSDEFQKPSEIPQKHHEYLGLGRCLGRPGCRLIYGSYATARR